MRTEVPGQSAPVDGVRFTKLFLAWFMTFGARTSLRLDRRKLVLVEGINHDDSTVESNGAGKSALFEAIVWCIYGKTIRKLAPDRVCNERTPDGEGTCVTLEFYVRRRLYRIERYRGHPKKSNKVFLYDLSDEKAKQLSAHDGSVTQEKIERLIGLDYTTFINCVFFGGNGQGTSKRFSTMTDGERKHVMESIIGVSAFAGAQKRAKAKRNELQRELDLLQIDEYEEALARAESRLNDLAGESQDWHTEQSNKIKRLTDQLGEKPSDDLTLLECNVSLLARASTLWRDRVATRGKAEAAATEQLVTLREQRRLVLGDIERIKLLASGAVAPGTVCLSCGTTVTDLTASSYQRHCKKEQRVAEEKLAQLDTDIAAAEAKAARATQQLERAEDRREHLLMGERRLERQVSDVRASVDAVSRLLEDIARLRRQTNPFKRLIEKERVALNEAADAFRRAKSQEASLRRRIEVYEYWVTGFGNSGLKSMLLDSVIPTLNMFAQKFSKRVTGGNIKVEFDTVSKLKSRKGERDDFDVRATNRNGSSVYEGNSGGEKAKVDVVIVLAFQALSVSRANKSVNIALFDESMEGCDGTAAEAVMELLSDVLKTRESVFMITHNEQLKPYFPSVITVEKKGKLSRVTRA